MKNDEFGDRMKAYESAFTSTKLDPSKWMAVRIDGRGFSKFTRSFDKPFDWRIANAMITTTKTLVKETHASAGFTQSDEITLLYPPTQAERIFAGKVSKINSVFASIATAHFNHHVLDHVDRLAYFDCRVWDVPNEVEASNVLLWRAMDARKNSVSAHFRWTAGHKAMQNLSSSEMIQYLIDHNMSDWYDLADVWKYGTYVKPLVRQTVLSPSELEDIPESKRPADPTVTRRVIETMSEIGFYGDMSLEERINFIS